MAREYQTERGCAAPVLSNTIWILLTQAGLNVQAWRHDNPSPYLQSYSLDFQYELGNGAVVEIGYTGNQGRKYAWGQPRNMNQVPMSFLNEGQALNNRVPNPFFGVLAAGPNRGGTIPFHRLLRLFPHFNNVNTPRSEKGATSRFDALYFKKTLLSSTARFGLPAAISILVSAGAVQAQTSGTIPGAATNDVALGISADAPHTKEPRPASAEHGGLRLDSREAALKGGGSGPAAIPREPDRSVLLQALIVAFRRYTLLPLDDCLYALRQRQTLPLQRPPTVPQPPFILAQRLSLCPPPQIPPRLDPSPVHQ